jgi:hypothetical protein
MFSDPKPTKKIKYHKCRFCKNDFVKTNPMITWCSYECGTQLALKKLELKKKSEAKEVNKAWKEKKAVYRAELSQGKQSQDPLQKSVNKIAMLLDKDEPCLARPFENCSQYNGGHVFSVGSWKSLRYHLWNIHKQSVKSNSELGGESLLMLEGLEIRYGAEIRLMVESLKIRYRELHLSDLDKKEALKIANKIIRDLEKGFTYTRDQINEYLGIYK